VVAREKADPLSKPNFSRSKRKSKEKKGFRKKSNSVTKKRKKNQLDGNAETQTNVRCKKGE